MAGGESGTVWEYELVALLLVFSSLSFIVLGYIGAGQAEQLGGDEGVNVFQGFAFLLKNQGIDAWSKLVYSAVVIVPLTVVGGMIVLNYVRGRS